MNQNDYQNEGQEYSDIDAEPVVGTVVKDVDSTIFSLRDNIRKGGPEGYMSKQGYLKNSDPKNLGRDSQNYTSAFQVEKSNQLPADDDLGTPPRVEGHEQNGYDFTLHTNAKDQNTRRKGTGDALESGSKVIRDFNPPTEMREPSEDGVGDDEPSFPIILNKHDLLKDQNRSYGNRFVSQEPDGDTDPNDDGAEGGDVPERDEPEEQGQEQDELEELEEQEEQDEDEEDDRSIEQKAVVSNKKNNNSSKLSTKAQPKKPQISLNAIRNTKPTGPVNQKIQEKKKSISITSKSPRNNENDKSDIDGILKQLAAFLANNTQGKGAANTSNMTSDQIDKKIKKLGKNPIKTLPPKKVLDHENESKVQKPKIEKPTRPTRKGGALPNLGIRYAYGDQNAPKNKSYTITEKIRANSRPKYMDAVRNPAQTPSPAHRITPNANLADLQKKQAAFDLTKPRTANNAQRGFSQDNKLANVTSGGRSKRISSNLLRPTPTPTRTFIKPSIRVEAAVRKSQDRGNLSARSSKSDLHAQQTSITPKKLNTNRSARGSGKKDVPQFDNNHLVRALYRVDRAVSKRSLSARSDLDGRRSPSVTDSTLRRDEMRDGVALRTENNDALRPRPNYFQNSVGPTDEDRNHTSIDAKKQDVPTTFHNIQQQQQRNSVATPNRSRSNFTRNDSFISPTQRDSSTRRNKQSIDRFAKDWEQYKRKVERGVISQNRPQIEFVSNQPQHTHYSTKGAGGFDRSSRFSSVTTRSGQPGPGRYHFVDTSLKGYSFGKEKRADMTSLYVVQDVNKMFDPIRMPH